MQHFSTSLLLMASVINMITLSSAKAMSNSTLIVTINGLRNQQGQVCFGLFSDAQGFPSNRSRAMEVRCLSAKDTPLTVTFNNLNAGIYAVTVFHDANGDGTLNRGFLGIPKEGFGFSRNPRIGTSPPSFKKAAVAITDQTTEIQIQLKYF